MASCVFFGNSDFSGNISDYLADTVKDLILTQKVDTFYVGHHGNFDRSVIRFLKRLKREYPTVHYFVMLSRLPCPQWLADEPTVFPEGIENVPPKYAILYRNDLMLEKADYVILYSRYSTGGTARMERKARLKGKKVIHLADPVELMKYEDLIKKLDEYDEYNSKKSKEKAQR